MTLKAEIAVQMYAACQKLGARSDLLQFIGAYGDSKSDKRVLEGLKQWNAANAGGRPDTAGNSSPA